MTIAVNFVTVANSIAGLSVSGVTLKSVGAIPDAGEMLCPILFPQPTGFVSNINPTNQSFGSMGTQKMDFEYSLHYVFLFAEIGSGLGSLAPYSPLIASLELVIEAILNNDVVSGLVDMQLESIDGIGEVQDPSGNSFWGALFSVRCLEYAQ